MDSAAILTEYLDSHPEFVALVQDGDIKISGCPNGCGQHHIAAIGFQGSVRKVGYPALPQYFVLVGGGTTDAGREVRASGVEGPGAPADDRDRSAADALPGAPGAG